MNKVKKAKMGATSGPSDRSLLRQFYPELAVHLNGKCPVQKKEMIL